MRKLRPVVIHFLLRIAAHHERDVSGLPYRHHEATRNPITATNSRRSTSAPRRSLRPASSVLWQYRCPGGREPRAARAIPIQPGLRPPARQITTPKLYFCPGISTSTAWSPVICRKTPVLGPPCSPDRSSEGTAVQSRGKWRHVRVTHFVAEALDHFFMLGKHG